MAVGLVIALPPLLSTLGHFLIRDQAAARAQVSVVLNTGTNYFPRLIQAADLFKSGTVQSVVINGNRKSDVLRSLEARGFEPAVSWDEDRFRILEILGVPRESVISISAEDVYDTVSEAQAVGAELVKRQITSVIVTTSKFHTRRAGHIWETEFDGKLKVFTAAAKKDPFDPDHWWRSGRQIRWVLAEYGAWIFYYWKRSSQLE